MADRIPKATKWLVSYLSVPLTTLRFIARTFRNNRVWTAEMLSRRGPAYVVRAVVLLTVLVWFIVWFLADDRQRHRLNDAVRGYWSESK